MKISCYSLGYLDGKSWRKRHAGQISSSTARRKVQEKWSRRARKLFGRNPVWLNLVRQGNRYAAGFRQGARIAFKLLPLPLRGTAAAVLHAPRQTSTLCHVLRQLRGLPLHQMVVVMHDATPAFFEKVRAQPDVLIVYSPEMQDPDGGRALGAKLTGTDTVLFVDAERPVKAAKLGRFLWAADSGLDAALNNVSAELGRFDQRPYDYRMAEFLNTSLRRTDLKANTMNMLPFALSRRALDSLGIAALMCPPKAHAAAILSGLKVGVGGRVPVRKRHKDSAAFIKTVLDYAEAWRHALSAAGIRLLYPDRYRNRQVIEEWVR
ncbi:family 2 glycosyl transferase [Cohnella pontilimi]|uniref:Family 2 glycosyl transferase n=1 Tax=Cohnella pontilimi TaxID=2564100 RepID=A0A4U0F646_9BACL|nr:family 2 glycosyl transferase [Cohnella pontilimi]TJY39748.1 family 2 glycosyl transferase [Cohnella pontilimi]